jgi:four helix bundle protein
VAIERFEQLEVWQSAHQLVLGIYRLTASFPADERFGLVAQMRRAAVSIPANIAEGFKRRSHRDKVHFYNISQGSLEEVCYHLLLAVDLKYAAASGATDQLVEQTARMLHGLIRSIDHRT